MVSILFNSEEPSEQSINTLSTRPMWTLVKIGQALSEKKTFKDYMILYYMYTANGQEQITPGGQNFDCN